MLQLIRLGGSAANLPPRTVAMGPRPGILGGVLEESCCLFALGLLTHCEGIRENYNDENGKRDNSGQTLPVFTGFGLSRLESLPDLVHGLLT